MHPVLFTLPEFLPLIGGYSLRVYGFLVALGFLSALIYVKNESRRVGLSPDRMMDLFFYIAVFSIVGARVLYVVNSVGNDFFSDPLMVFRFWEGGLVFQGGVLGAIIVGIYYTRKHKMEVFKTADVFMPGLALGHAIGRIGCFFAGCCYGRQCSLDAPFAVIFPHDPLSVAPPGIPLYPTQLFESFGEFAIFGFLLWYRRHKPFDGAVFLVYLMIYSVLRSVLEMYRGDKIRGFVIEPYLSNGQFISLVTIIVCLFLWVYLKKRKAS